MVHQSNNPFTLNSPATQANQGFEASNIIKKTHAASLLYRLKNPIFAAPILKIIIKQLNADAQESASAETEEATTATSNLPAEAQVESRVETAHDDLTGALISAT